MGRLAERETIGPGALLEQAARCRLSSRLCRDLGRVFGEAQGAGATMMDEHVYKIIQLAGSSEKSIEDAIQNAVTRASKTLHGLRWFEVLETRGHIENNQVAHYQVVIKVGFTLEG
jgi:hypothetical protein